MRPSRIDWSLCNSFILGPQDCQFNMSTLPASCFLAGTVFVCITATNLFQLNLIHDCFRVYMSTALSLLSIRKPVNFHTFGICWPPMSAHPTSKGICILRWNQYPSLFGSRWLELVAAGLGFNAQHPLQFPAHPAQLLPAHALKT